MAPLAALLVPSLVTAAGGDKLVAHMTGDQVTGDIPGDPDGTGTANVAITAAKQRVCFRITYENIGTATGGEIMKGEGFVRRPIVELFGGPNSGNRESPVHDCLHVINRPRKLNKIVENPGDYDVTLRSPEYNQLDGAIRGQLEQAP